MHGVLTAFTVYYRAMREWEVGKVVKESTQDKGLTLTGLQPYQNYTLQVSDLYLCKCLPKDHDKGRSHFKKTVKKGALSTRGGGEGVNPSSFFKLKFTGFSNHSEMDF